jgi:thiol-disulfide isomerase/thioredoxin
MRRHLQRMSQWLLRQARTSARGAGLVFVALLMASAGNESFAQSVAGTAEDLLRAAVAKIAVAKTMKSSVDVRIATAGSSDTLESHYYLVAERCDSLRLGCRLYGFTSRDEFLLYDGDQMLVGYPDVGRMTRYRRGRIPGSLLYSSFIGWETLPLPRAESFCLKVLNDSTTRYDPPRFGVDGKDSVILIAVQRGGNSEIAALHHVISLRAVDFVPMRIITLVDVRGMGRQYTDIRADYLMLDSPVEPGLFSGATLPKDLEITDADTTLHRSMPTLQPGEEAPEIAARTWEGDSLRLSDFRGQVVFLDFFYATCAPCRRAIPDIVALHEEFRDRDVVFLGVNSTDSSGDKVLGWLLDTNRVRYPILLCERATDYEYKVSGFPTTMVIGRDGRIVSVDVGYNGEESRAAWRRELLRALEE